MNKNSASPNTVYAAQPREGTETQNWDESGNRLNGKRFMQLNPARGRKHLTIDHCLRQIPVMVYAAQPREGTETRHTDRYRVSCHRLTVYAAQPREGTETKYAKISFYAFAIRGLCSSTPRGDGNARVSRDLQTAVLREVYAAQPREGTETIVCTRRSHWPHVAGLCSSTPRGDGNRTGMRLTPANSPKWFMQLNPARGRKLGGRPTDRDGLLGLCSSTPRGDGNRKVHRLISISRKFSLCSSTPRGDGNPHRPARAVNL